MYRCGLHGRTAGTIEGAVYVTMESHNEGFHDPMHDLLQRGRGQSRLTPLTVPLFMPVRMSCLPAKCRYFKAFGHKLGAHPEDSGITSQTVNNSGGVGELGITACKNVRQRFPMVLTRGVEPQRVSPYGPEPSASAIPPRVFGERLPRCAHRVLAQGKAETSVAASPCEA